MKKRFGHESRKKHASETTIRKINQKSNINSSKLSSTDQEINQSQTFMRILRRSRFVSKSEQDNYVIIEHFK